jgi:hypothetical protein
LDRVKPTVWLLRVAGAVAGLSAVVCAQTPGGEPVAPPAQGAQGAPSPAATAKPVALSDEHLRKRVTEAASICVARVAQFDVRIGGGADARDYWIAAELLQIAHDLNPGDAEILRLLIEARGGAGEPEAVDALSRELLKLDPADSVTQLRVISSEIGSRNQSAEERLRAYDLFLGPRGAGFDGSVRSRLALDSALLLREQGDLDGFAKRLALSTELDSTNKDAATLALNFFAEQTTDPVGRAELFLNVIYSDPFDPDAHLGLARELARNGAYVGASRFYANYQTLCGLQGCQPDAGANNEHHVLDWLLTGAEDYVRRATESVTAARDDLMKRRSELELSGVTENLPEPMEAGLPMDLERLRVLAAAATGRRDLVEPAVRDMGLTVDRTKQELADPRKRTALGLDEAQAKELARSLTQESAWLCLWTAADLDRANRDFQEIRSNPATDPRDVQRMDAWFKLRYGELDAAESALRALGNETLSQVGLAVLAELRGKPDEAIAAYIAIAKNVPGAPAGAYAQTRALKLIEETGSKATIEPMPAAKQLELIAKAVPNWLEGMLENPLEFMTLRAELVGVDGGRVGMFDRMAIRVKLRNVSRFPLALGPDKPLNSRLLFVPSVRVGSELTQRPGMHAVASIDRRMRLLPREELSVDLWPDNGFVGMMLQENLNNAVNVRWRVLQGFHSVRGLYEEGPQCLSTEVGSVSRPASSVVLGTVDDLRRVINTGTPLEVCEAALAFRDRAGTGPVDKRLKQLESDAIMDDLLRRFSSMDRSGKLFLLAALPTYSAMTAMSKLDEVASRDPDMEVRRFCVLARTPGADSPLLQDQTWTGNDRMLKAARMVRERLAENKRTYARPHLPDDEPSGDAPSKPDAAPTDPAPAPAPQPGK